MLDNADTVSAIDSKGSVNEYDSFIDLTITLISSGVIFRCMRILPIPIFLNSLMR